MKNPNISISRYRYSIMEEPRMISLREAPLPQLAPDEVLLQVAYCGICATDIAILNGKRQKRFPYTPGHEYTGTIVAIGTEVNGFSPGDRVVGNPNFVCGTCYYCSQAEYHLCVNADEPHFSNGGFADYLTINYNYVYHLPAHLPMKDATLTECLACVIHAISHLAGQTQKVALVIGAGTMGLLVVEVLRHLKLAKTIIVSEPNAAKQAIARQFGAASTVGSMTSTIEQAIHAINPYGADLVVECAGSILAVENALLSVRRGGKILLVGRASDEEYMPLRPGPLARTSLSVIGSSRYKPEDFEKAVLWLSQGVITTQKYFDRIFDIEDLEMALQFAGSGNGIKTLVRCTTDLL